jgi:hypothetical protein
MSVLLKLSDTMSLAAGRAAAEGGATTTGLAGVPGAGAAAAGAGPGGLTGTARGDAGICAQALAARARLSAAAVGTVMRFMG